MPRSSRSRRVKRRNTEEDNDEEEETVEETNAPGAAAAGGRQLPAHVRNRQRAVAEREAARLARPERRAASTLGHADRKKSAVTSTPFGILAARGSSNVAAEEVDDSWCGPFTVARQMIAAREDAKRQREADLEESKNDGENHPLDQAMEELEEEKQKKAHPSLLWKSRLVTPDTKKTAAASANNKSHKRIKLPARRDDYIKAQVPSLYQLCVNFVVTNFEHVEALGPVGHEIRTSIAHTLASQNRLDQPALAALTDDTMESLELVDCADIPQEALCDLLKRTCLKHLQLDQAGRCFAKQTVEALIHGSGGKLSGAVPLFALHVGGAYLLQDVDAAKLIAALSSTLQSLAWKACPLLGMEMCKSIPAIYGSPTTTQNCLLEFSLEDMTLSRESWEALVLSTTTPDKNQMWQRNLKSLSLRRVTNLQDDLVIALLQGAPNLEHVDLSDNHELTDATLSALRPPIIAKDNESSIKSFSLCLRSLNLSSLKRVTQVGLETLFTPGLEGMGPPPQLKVLNLSHMDVGAVTDNVMDLVLQCASRKLVTADTAAAKNDNASSGLSLLGGMVRLELQGAAITDSTLEQIVATSAKTLEYLQVSFCPYMTDQGLGYLVDNVGNQLEEVQIWGCAQITEQFWNGHARAIGVVEGSNKATTSATDYAVVPLQITGAWMKKSGIASIRN